MRSRNFFVLTFLTLFPTLLQAQVSVDRSVVIFKAGEKPFQNIVVQNSGKEPLYLEGIVESVENPGFPEEKRTPTEELLATPKRFSVEPGAQRTVRLVLKHPSDDAERTFRMKFLPRAKEFDVSAAGSQTKTQLKIVFSVGILIFAEPSEPKEELKEEWNDQGLVLKNTGNVNQMFEEVKLCTGEDENCESVTAVRLYPGNEHLIKVPSGKKVFAKKQVRERHENVVFAR